MHRQSVRELEPDEFEWVCGGIIGEIATEFRLTPSGPPKLMAPTSDGGVEAKIPTSTDYLAIQCKTYKRSAFAAEAKDVKKSFATFLDKHEHDAVGTYIWCSSSSRTAGPASTGAVKTGNETKAEKAIEDMIASAKAKNRSVVVEVLFAEDIDRIIREHRPEYLAVMNMLSPIGFEEVERYSTARVSEMLSRLGGDNVPQLEFPVPQTSEFLERLRSSSKSPGLVETAGIEELLDEVNRRAHDIPQTSRVDTNSHDSAPVIETELFKTCSLLSAEEIKHPLTKLRDEAQSTFDNTMTELKAHKDDPVDRSDEGIKKQQLLEAIIAHGKSLLTLLEHIHLILRETEAVITRQLLITGQWGSGKSYQLAAYTQRSLRSDSPVLLLRARDFTLPDAPIFGQPWRGNFDNMGAEPAQFAALLDSIGHRAKQPLVLIIDGLNESSIRHVRAAMDRVVELIDRFPNLRLIVSTRRDHLPADDVGMPELVHRPPDQVTLSRSLETTLNVPPGTDWHAALTNPLLASVAVRILNAQPDESHQLLSRTTLFEAWVNLLAHEAATVLPFTPSTIQRVISAISATDGRDTIPDIAAVTSLTSDNVDAIIHRLVNEGFLEVDPTATDTVRFRWEAIYDIFRARRAISESAIDKLIRDANGDEDRKLALLDLLAELLPQSQFARELPSISLPSVTAEEQNMAFAFSLSGRNDDNLLQETFHHAERILRQGGDASQAIVRSILSDPRRKGLGFDWLNGQLRETTLHQRAKFWPRTLEELCDRSQADQKDMQSLLSWYATDLWPFLSGVEAESAVELLAWISCASFHTALPAYAIRNLTELLYHYPEHFEGAIGRLQEVDDDHPRDALFLAASGVVARWPGSRSAQIANSTSSLALDNEPKPQSLRSLAAIHFATSSKIPIHLFLREAIHELPRRSLLSHDGLIGEDDRAMFADGRNARKSAQFETRILDSFGIKKKHRKVVLGTNQEFRSNHGRSLVLGRWLAHQYAKYRVGARIFKGATGPIKAGTIENLSTALLDNPGAAWDFFVDPTVPSAFMLCGSDAAQPNDWWAVDSQAISSPECALEKTDPEGNRWIVLNGEFRHLEPLRERKLEPPTLRLGRSRWMLGGDDDGRPTPGRSRHEFVRISDATLYPVPISDENRSSCRPIGQERFADNFDIGSPDGELITTNSEDSIVGLTNGLPHLLGVRWTGWGLDCVEPDGTLVVMDPAVGLNAPHAVLVRRDALYRALKETDKSISMNITVTDVRPTIFRQPQHVIASLEWSENADDLVLKIQ